MNYLQEIINSFTGLDMSMKPRLTLEGAKRKYKMENKKCEYCEFSKYEKVLDDSCSYFTTVFTKSILWCQVKEHNAKEVCEFYQVK